jgi:tyramine---L-glutamate ligase
MPKAPPPKTEITKRRVFVSEFVTGGAWPETEVEPSLIQEGAGMLRAVVNDILADNDTEIRTTWNSRLGEFPELANSLDSIDARLINSRLTVQQVGSVEEEADAFRSGCRWATDVLVIAPEFHDILKQRRELFETTSNANWLGCGSSAIDLCTDKLKLATHLSQHKIPTVPTEAFAKNHPTLIDGFRFPIVIKPRDGAGSTETHRVDSAEQLRKLAEESLPSEFEYIQQPFVPGTSVSVAAIIQHGEVVMLFPPGQQQVENDGRFAYQGVDFSPAFASTWSTATRTMIEEVVQAIPDLNGYIGFDLIIPASSPTSLVVLEINSRLTTGFLAWQRLKSNTGSILFGSCTKLSCDEELRFRI